MGSSLSTPLILGINVCTNATHSCGIMANQLYNREGAIESSGTFSAKRYDGSCSLNHSRSLRSGYCRLSRNFMVFLEIWPGGT
jgi:hypothetical protein